MLTESNARPVPSKVELVARVEAIREKVLGGTPAKGSPHIEGVRTMNDSVTLMLHGDICAGTAPHLEAVLEGLVQLQPLHLIIDLSEVGSVSFDALRMIDRYGAEVGDLVLQSVNSTIRSDLELLGQTTLRCRLTAPHSSGSFCKWSDDALCAPIHIDDVKSNGPIRARACTAR